MLNSLSEEIAIEDRNYHWRNNDAIPPWVKVENVGLDQFFTEQNVAQNCLTSFFSYLESNNIDYDKYDFLEPSAGAGSFYDLLPRGKRIGFDIMPLHSEIKNQDFLSWKPRNKNKKYIIVGNPPFGYRAWLALTFLNHAAQFADYVGFILPMAFQSDGKGSPKHRVKGMKLVHSEIIPPNSFFSPDGKVFKVNALWQIWEKGENKIPEKKTCSQWLDLFTVDMRKERLCGQDRFEEADFFLQRTFYNQAPSLVKCFSHVKYVCGYGLIIKKDREKIIKLLNNTDWSLYSNLAAHNCRHISMYHIVKVLTDNGYIDV